MLERRDLCPELRLVRSGGRGRRGGGLQSGHLRRGQSRKSAGGLQHDFRLLLHRRLSLGDEGGRVRERDGRSRRLHRCDRRARLDVRQLSATERRGRRRMQRGGDRRDLLHADHRPPLPIRPLDRIRRRGHRRDQPGVGRFRRLGRAQPASSTGSVRGGADRQRCSQLSRVPRSAPTPVTTTACRPTITC